MYEFMPTLLTSIQYLGIFLAFSVFMFENLVSEGEKCRPDHLQCICPIN